MSKQKPIVLNILKPCTENWDDMNVVDKGRFCSHCQKTVTDITGMTDTAIVQLFQQQKDTHCIRAFSSQLNRQITLPAQAPTRFYRIAVALGLTIIMTGTVDAYARPRAPLVEQNYLLDTGDSTKSETTGGDSITISGVVVDETGKPFGGVVVKLFHEGLLKTGNVTDDDGSFRIKWIRSNYTLEFSSLSYEAKRFEIDIKSGNFNDTIKLVEHSIMLGGMGIITDPTTIFKSSKSGIDLPGLKIFTEEELKRLGY